MTLSRRNLVLSSGIGIAAAALALSGCVTTKDGTNTKYSLDVTKVGNYARAGINAATTVIGVLSLVPALSPVVSPIKEIANAIQTNLDAFLGVAGDKVVVDYDNADVKTKVGSILANLERLVGMLTTAAAALGVDIGEGNIAKVDLTLNALKTLVSIFNVLVGGTLTTANGNGSLTESQALAALGIN